MKAFGPTRQRGNALLETALIMPLLIGTALISADLYNVSQARSYMEQSAHNIASVLAMQNRMDSNGLQALIDQAAAPALLGDYELVISRVSLDRAMPWKPLYRGSMTELCPTYSDAKYYTGELPEEKPAKEQENEATKSTSTTSILVVQLCRNSDSLALSSGLLVDKTMHSIAFSRMSYDDLKLDDALAQEVGQEPEKDSQ